MTTTTDEAVAAQELLGVALVHWPRDEALRAELAGARRPRLLLLEPRQAPPVVWDELEDWVRLPSDNDEVAVRAETLRRRAAAGDGASPVLDAEGILRLGSRWAAIPPVEARMLAPLLQARGRLVPREELLAAGWPHGAPTPRVIDRRILLLRGRIGPLGLVIRTVRGRGFLLEPSQN